MCLPGAHEGQMRVFGALELELQMVWVLGIKSGSSSTAGSVFNEPSPQPSCYEFGFKGSFFYGMWAALCLHSDFCQTGGRLAEHRSRAKKGVARVACCVP